MPTIHLSEVRAKREQANRYGDAHVVMPSRPDRSIPVVFAVEIVR